MKKFFIIEGPDRTGKTTLAHFIKEHINISRCATYFHCDFTPLLAQAMYDYQCSVVKNMEVNHRMGNSIIIDRLWPSNEVYRKVVDNQQPCDWTEMRELLRKIGVVYIFADCESCFERHKADKDPAHPYDDTKYRAIVQGYRDLYQELSVTDNCIRYDLDVWMGKTEEFMGALGL